MRFFRRAPKGDEGDPEARSPQTGIKYKDLSVLNVLIQHGADLSQPRHVLYFLYFGSEQAARQGARIASARQFDATVGEPLPEYPGQWSLTCEAHGVVLDDDTVRSNGDFFEGLATQLGGEYDGWEASV